MKLAELMGENASAAKSALRLVELNAQQVTEEASDEVLEILESQDHVELIKGLCFIVCVVSSFLSGGAPPAPVFHAIRMSMDVASEEGHDVKTNYKVLDLLDAVSELGGSFYLQAYSLKEPFEVILGLTTLFQTLVKTSLGKDIDEVTDYLTHMIDESF